MCKAKSIPQPKASLWEESLGTVPFKWTSESNEIFRE